MALFGDINWNDVEETGGEFVPLEPGEYGARVVETTMGPNKAGTGKNVVVEFEVTTGERAGYKMKVWHVWEHTNAVAVNIGRGKLKKLMTACGLDPLRVKDTDEMLGRSCGLVIKRGEYDGSPTAEVKAYKPAPVGVDTAPVSAQAQGTASPWGA